MVLAYSNSQQFFFSELLHYFITGIQEEILGYLYAYTTVCIGKHAMIPFSISFNTCHDAMSDFRARIVVSLIFVVTEPSPVFSLSAQ